MANGHPSDRDPSDRDVEGHGRPSEPDSKVVLDRADAAQRALRDAALDLMKSVRSGGSLTLRREVAAVERQLRRAG